MCVDLSREPGQESVISDAAITWGDSYLEPPQYIKYRSGCEQLPLAPPHTRRNALYRQLSHVICQSVHKHSLRSFAILALHAQLLRNNKQLHVFYCSPIIHRLESYSLSVKVTWLYACKALHFGGKFAYSLLKHALSSNTLPTQVG